MQNPIQEFREGSIVFEKPGTENFDKLQLPHSLILKLRAGALLTNAYKRVFGIFFILFRS